MNSVILGIESSCDDTSAAVIVDGVLRSNVIASQKVHEAYGGVVPELASRAHQQNIVPVVSEALKQANVKPSELSAIAFTRGPGLLGSLLVGVSFAKGMAIGLNKPIVDVNHLHAHVLSHFIKKEESDEVPEFPFMCLLISGGNSQIILVKDYNDMTILGQTIDDAAGEAFDKCAKVMGLPYPGGPVIDRLAKEGNAEAFTFSKPHVKGEFDYSFSGLKTSFLYTLRDCVKEDADFVEKNKADLCASLQKTIIDILLDKLIKATKKTGIKDVAIAGGVSANSGLREAVAEAGRRRGWRTFIPELKFTTDNAAMIAISGYYRYRQGMLSSYDIAPVARLEEIL